MYVYILKNIKFGKRLFMNYNFEKWDISNMLSEKEKQKQNFIIVNIPWKCSQSWGAKRGQLENVCVLWLRMQSQATILKTGSTTY